MKCRTIIDKNRDEEVVIYVHEKSKLSDAIEEYVMSYTSELIGYSENGVIKINLSEVYCFTVEDGKIYVLTEKEKYRLKQRLYTVEEGLNDDFVKINQSCIVNVKKILRFDASLAGALSLTLKNGYRDYVSRRQLKYVKERIGF